ncbi:MULTISPECIES: hypothetical protein [unclassified Mesorhizobium]|uniref:hypothetical protein n=1 Tax=unclassified Mesorhizobium TaxID=325217 RepID=UPI00163DE566|nr:MULTISPECIES: hypothetical protein [unclassified Mesorhizobium]
MRKAAIVVGEVIVFAGLWAAQLAAACDAAGSRVMGKGKLLHGLVIAPLERRP